MNIGYIRTFEEITKDKNQKELLEKHNIDKWFIDELTFENSNRNQLNDMLKFVREGDYIYVTSLDRLALSISDLLSLVNTLEDNKITLISLKENIDTSTTDGKLACSFLSHIFNFEKTISDEKNKEKQLAKKHGYFKGRGSIKIEDVKDFEENYQLYMTRELTKVQMAKNLNVSRPTLDKLIKMRKSK